MIIDRRSDRFRSRSSLKKGSTLIAIFWIMTILILAAFASMAVVKMQAEIVTAESHSKRARELAEKGIALSSHPALQRSDPLLQLESEGEGYRATYESMSTSFGLNAHINRMKNQLENNEILSTTDSFLGTLLTVEWGMPEGEADLFLSNLIEWVDADDQVTTATGWESGNYESEGIFGRPYNRFLKSLEEVTLVRGYESLEAVRPDWRNFFNIWTGLTIDLSSAEPEMISLASLTETGRLISVEDAEMIYEQIIGEDGIRDSEDDLQGGNVQQILINNMSGDPSIIADRYAYEGNQPDLLRLISTGWSGDVRITVSMALQGGRNSPRLLERTEVIDYSP